MQTSKPFISISNIKDIELITNPDFSLDSNDIIIYTVYLPSFINLKLDLIKFLNSDEINRAERFHKKIDRNRFIICRSVLKFVLRAYTKLEVKDINFDYQSNKKPFLASYPWLHFNVSHSEDFAVIAISGNEIGIDIEYISEDFNFTDLLQDIFNEEEVLEIQNAEDKRNAFYTLWTRKESFVKALGKGIDDDFKNIPCLNGKHYINSSLLKTTINWQVDTFKLADHYLGAVAFESMSTISKNLVFHSIPNTMKELLEMIQTNND